MCLFTILIIMTRRDPITSWLRWCYCPSIYYGRHNMRDGCIFVCFVVVSRFMGNSSVSMHRMKRWLRLIKHIRYQLRSRRIQSFGQWEGESFFVQFGCAGISTWRKRRRSKSSLTSINFGCRTAPITWRRCDVMGCGEKCPNVLLWDFPRVRKTVLILKHIYKTLVMLRLVL